MTRKRKSLLVFAAALAAAVAVVAGGGSAALGGGSSKQSAAKLPTLRIGTVLPFTGGLAESAREMQTAFNLYIKQHGGKLGGLPVKVFYEDSQEQPALDVTLTKKLIAQDNVHLLSGAMLAFEGLAMVPTITKSKIALVGMTGVTADEYRKIRSPYISLAAKHMPDQEEFPLGTYAYKNLKYRRAAVVCQDYAWGWQTCGGFEYAFEKAGGTIVQKIYPPLNTTDYSPYVTQIKQDVDVVYATTVGPDVPRFVKAYSDFGLMGKIPLIGSEDLVAADAYRYYSTKAAGILGSTPFTTALKRPEMQRYVKAYEAVAGKAPTFWGEAAYTAAMIVDRTLSKLRAEGVPAQSLPEYVRSHAAKFIATIRQINLSDVPSSPVEVDPYNVAIRNFYLVKLVDQNGKIAPEVVKTFPHVSEFWIFNPKTILALPVFSKSFPSH
jgi:branched-chain amino acid transport system substrate-binding protein